MRLALLALLALLLVPGRASAALVCSPEDDEQPPYVLGDVDDDNDPEIVQR